MRRPYAVLSIDGGGIRGIIPAVLLAEIEERAGHHAAELFDLIAGTSSGGMLALVLAKPDPSSGRPAYDARDGIRLYEQMGSRIFDRSAWRKARSLNAVLEEKYPSDGIEAVLEEFFGQSRLKDAATDVLVTSYDIERAEPFFFKSRKAQEDPEGYDFAMKDAARATSAAPTYFEPHRVQTDPPKDYHALIDGGVFAANPAMCAYVEARSLLGKDPCEGGGPLLVVSLGAGEHKKPLLYEEARGWGARHWARPLPNILLNGMSDTVDHQMRELVAEGELYYRFQTALSRGLGALDDAEAANVRALKLAAEKLIEREDENLTTLCEQLGRVAREREEDDAGSSQATTVPRIPLEKNRSVSR